MKNYSFTFTIPACKKVYWNGRKRTYGGLSPSQQFHFLEDLMGSIIYFNRVFFIDWVYEKHEDGRLHIHGFVNLEDDYDSEIYLLRDRFYSYNHKVGIIQKSYLKISDIQETLTNINYWTDYMAKNQHNIIYKNGYNQQLDYINAVDAGIVKIIDNKKYRRPEGYWETYRIGQDIPIYETDSDLSVEF